MLALCGGIVSSAEGKTDAVESEKKEGIVGLDKDRGSVAYGHCYRHQSTASESEIGRGERYSAMRHDSGVSRPYCRRVTRKLATGQLAWRWASKDSDVISIRLAKGLAALDAVAGPPLKRSEAQGRRQGTRTRQPSARSCGEREDDHGREGQSDR